MFVSFCVVFMFFLLILFFLFLALALFFLLSSFLILSSFLSPLSSLLFSLPPLLKKKRGLFITGIFPARNLFFITVLN